jgi:hypothetical protein
VGVGRDAGRTRTPGSCSARKAQCLRRRIRDSTKRLTWSRWQRVSFVWCCSLSSTCAPSGVVARRCHQRGYLSIAEALELCRPFPGFALQLSLCTHSPATRTALLCLSGPCYCYRFCSLLSRLRRSLRFRRRYPILHTSHEATDSSFALARRPLSQWQASNSRS